MTEASENSYQEAMEAMREALRTSERLELDANRLSCRVRGALWHCGGAGGKLQVEEEALAASKQGQILCVHTYLSSIWFVIRS